MGGEGNPWKLKKITLKKHEETRPIVCSRKSLLISLVTNCTDFTFGVVFVLAWRNIYLSLV